MTDRNHPFILADGSIDTKAAMAAGRHARSQAFHDMMRGPDARASRRWTSPFSVRNLFSSPEAS